MINPAEIADKMIELYKDNPSVSALYSNAKKTWEISGQLFKSNASLNKDLPYHDMNELIGMHKGKTTYLAAFGPSLRYSYKDLLDKDCIVGCDRGYYWYRDHGIDPDVIITMDAHMLPEYIGDHDITDRALIAHVGSNHIFCKEWADRGGKIYFYNANCAIKSNQVYDIIFDREIFYIDALSNVACGLLVMCDAVFKSENIELYGYDHSWQQEWYYPDQKIKDSHIPRRKKLYRTEGNHGETCYFDDTMYCYLHHMLQILDYYNLKNKVVNKSPGILKL